MTQFVMSIDQGTTGTTVVILDEALQIHGKANTEFPQIYPQPGWVEHDPETIWQSVISSVQKALSDAQLEASQLSAIGITNQRETSLLWDKVTGVPVYNAIVWQCRRTSPFCKQLKQEGHETLFREKTGLVLDPYFSGTKVRWILDNVPQAREKALKGDLLFGTIETYLVWKLTGGKSHVTDVSNASRTLMMDLATCEWDSPLLEILDIPRCILPEIRGNSEIYGETVASEIFGSGIPVAGMAGDQQAALFGQACFSKGDAKCTFGTGAFLLMNTGKDIVYSKNGLLTTVAWKLKEETIYALEGSVFIAGAAVQFLRDNLHMFEKSEDVEKLASEVKDSGGVVFVPALAGLGAPHWNAEARGMLWGMTRGTTQGHIARATLEGVAFMTHDVLSAMAEDVGISFSELKVDGGASANSILMQFQADLLQGKVIRPEMIETTALGAAFLAGLGAGVWSSTEAIQQAWKKDAEYLPLMKESEVHEKLQLWKKVVAFA